MQREIILEMPDPEEYRVVCRFGYNYLITMNWWAHLQRRITYKRFLFFGATRYRWREVNRCWWTRQIQTMEELKRAAEKFYDETILEPQRIVKRAIDL